jgi:Flp pilus assembly protein TadG
MSESAIKSSASSVFGMLRAFGGDPRGSLALITALCSTVLFAVLAVAIDYVMMTRIQGQLQAAADGAALAGVKELRLAGTTEKQIKAVAMAFVHYNFAEEATKDKKPGLDIDVKIIQAKSMVEVTLRQNWTPFLLHFMGNRSTSIKVVARAQTWKRLACVVGLSPLVPPGVQLWSDASLTAEGCDVYSNTDLPAGLVVNDDATLKANLICVSGGYVAISPQAVSPDPLTDCPPYEDPLASREAPEVGPCDHIATIILNKNRTLDPGVYCGGLTILGKSKVTLNPGVYIIHNGLLKVAGSASMSGENVGFYLSGLATLMYFDSNSSIDITAPKDGPLAGILFFEDRKAPPLRVHRIGSNNARNLLGTIYLPLGILLVDANAPVADNSAYTAIVVRSLQLREGPKLVLHSDYQSTDVPVPEGLFTGRVVLTE